MFCFLERIMEDKHILTGMDPKKGTELYFWHVNLKYNRKSNIGHFVILFCGLFG